MDVDEWFLVIVVIVVVEVVVEVVRVFLCGCSSGVGSTSRCL